MKCKILHESNGRMRLHAEQTRMTLRQADILEAYLRQVPGVTEVKIYDRTCDAVVLYRGARTDLIRALAAFSYDASEALAPEHSSRALGREYEDKLVLAVCRHYFKKLFLPMPLRMVITLFRSVHYLRAGLSCLLHGKIQVPVLDATAIGVSMLRGDFATAGSIMFLLGIGDILDEWTHKKSVADLAQSMSLNVDKVWLQTPQGDVLVPLHDVQVGDRISVRTGGMIPLDGKVVSGEAMVNQASITGEPLAVRKSEGGYVYAGTVIEEGDCVVLVEKAAGSGRYDRIVHMIEESEKLKSAMEDHAAHLADRLVPYSLGATALIWLLTRNVTQALAVLMVDFSCALKLSMPIAVLSAMKEAAGYHLSVKGGRFLEAVSEADTIVFDKTGTLTRAEPKVAQIVTFGTMAARGAIRAVGRALNMTYADCDVIAKLVPGGPGNLHITLDDALKLSRELREKYENDEQVKKLIDTARALEGMPRHASTHAAGVVITKRPVVDYVPLATNDDAVVCQYVMTTLEELGLLKMDFLGLRNLTVLDDAVKTVQKTQPGFKLADIPENDPETYEMLAAGKTSGVFQLESSGMTGVCVSLKPQNIEDITALIALYRPGPMDSIPKFIACKHDPSKVTYLIPQLEPILSITYGCIVYQEQVIQIFQQLAGYTLGQADMLRRAMSKKKVKDIEKERGAFLHGDPSRGIKGCIANGISESAAQAIYDDIYAFANYAFNKAHAAAYAVIAYQTAYFKCHFPKEYMAALLTSVLDSSEKIAEYIGECRECAIALLPPDVNRSDDRFTVEPEGIRFGLVAIKNIGRGLITRMMREREVNGPFADFQDFCYRMDGNDMNKRAVENLIRAGAFDSMGTHRSQLIAVYEKVMDGISNGNRVNIEGQMDFFGMGGGSAQREPLHLPDIPEFSAQERMAMEKETTGLYLSGHPMDAYRELSRRLGAAPIGRILEDFAQEAGPTSFADGQKLSIAGVVTSSKVKTTRSNTLMAYVTVEDSTGTMEMLCFARTLETSGSYLKEGQTILASGRLSVRDEKAPQLMCDSARPLGGSAADVSAGAAGEKRQTLYLRLPSMDSHEMTQFRRIAYLFEGKEPVRIRLIDSGKLIGTTAVLHPAFVRAMRELLGDENVVLK